MDGDPSQAAGHLRQTLSLYQHIGAPRRRRVKATLQRADLYTSERSVT
jgi:hypothetical protein